MQLAAYGLADTPPNTVPCIRLAERARSRETNVGTVGLLLADTKGGKERAAETAALVVNSSKVLGSQQADTFWKTQIWRVSDLLPLGTDCELLAAPRAPAGKHRPSVLSLHPRTEAVRLGAVTIVRLKSAFRHLYSTI